MRSQKSKTSAPGFSRREFLLTVGATAPTISLMEGEAGGAPNPRPEPQARDNNGKFTPVDLSAYFNSSSPSSPTGSLYVCGKSGGTPTLYKIPISSNTMGTVKTGPTLASATTPCSNLSEVYNAGASGGPFDWIYASVQASGSPSGCASGGCIINYIVTAWQAGNAYALGQQILDTNLNIQKVTRAGTSGSTAPTTWDRRQEQRPGTVR